MRGWCSWPNTVAVSCFQKFSNFFDSSLLLASNRNGSFILWLNRPERIRESCRIMGVWYCSYAKERDLFENVLESPDINDQFLNILANLNIESKYYKTKQSGTCFQKFNSRGFSIFNCNIRSSGKNLCLLNDIFTVKEMPSIITIFETKLTDNN